MKRKLFRKIVSIILLCILTLNTVACGESTEVVELTMDNVFDYFVINYNYTSFTERVDKGGVLRQTDTKVIVDIYPVQGKSFQNVEIELSFDTRWFINDDNIQDDNGVVIIPMKLPTDGVYQTSFELTYPVAVRDPHPAVIAYASVSSVSGKVEVLKE